ncbi:PAS domain S-box protein [Pulveribacter suum]|uniref:Sensor protein FixL n=1 Tax=Pulveribacter suum TaxID=2116657 RepID=A0A2P1NH32_9BURK|nr:PAS domain S-box protein [Pulveribacter suum]AVP56361.1 histidine kinase [Pulveribacter suum]
MLDSFFASGLEPYPLLWRQHDPLLVLLSILLDIGASIVALHMAALARRSGSAGMRQLALASGTLALGAGIWAMHFVAMLAFAVCAQGRFNPWTTAWSILPSLLASWVALRLLAQPHIRLRALVGSGVLVGAGIGAMHYLGMQASDIAPILRYDPLGFAVSIAVAVLLAVLALWVRFGLRGRWLKSRALATVLAGSVMGLAITGMHYTGMAAIRFVQPVSSVRTPQASGPVHFALPLAIVLITTALFLLALAINVSLRYRQMLRQTQASESRQRAVLETAVDGIVMIDGRGTVQSFNLAAERLFGWRADEVIGRNVNMLMPEPHRSAHDGYLHAHLTTGRKRIIGTGREIEAQRKDGTLMPMRLAVGRVQQEGQTLFVGFLTDLSAYKALERERARDQEQLRSLMANLPGVAFRCRHGGDWPMLLISDGVQALTGWSAQDFLDGRKHFGQLIHPQDGQRIAGELEQALAGGRPYQLEYRITTQDGGTRWVAEYGRGVPDEEGTVRFLDGVILDITESKARNAEFAGIVTAIGRSQPAAEFDLAGQLVGANAPYLALVGYELGELLGQPHALLFTRAGGEGPGCDAFWRSLAQGEVASGEFQATAKGGRALWLHATYNPIFDAEGRVTKVMQFATDLSARRAMEQDLRAAKERAEGAAAARSTFLANMSHEIRTPMNAIIGFTEALLDSPLEAGQRRHLGIVQHSARSMLRLLNDILDTAKLEKGAVELEVAPFSLRELCEQMLASLRITAARKGLALELDYGPDVPEFWHGDAFRIQQIVLNLMGNALKFTHEGGVRLRVAGEGGALTLSVQDTGIGIDAAGLARIFEPFSQADASTTRRYGGTGLGTTIARQLAELMHGRIEVASRMGQGSTFSVHLPLRQASAPQGAAGAAAPQALPSLAPLRVLAVDDVPVNLELLALMLEPGGHRVQGAGGGAQALAHFERERFDVVLMDLQMPDMDGMEATRRMRERERSQGLRPTPIVALSASVLEQDRRNARAAGMDGFAGKPVELPHLMAEIARVLGLAPLAPTPARAQPPAAGAPAPAAIDWDLGVRLWTQARFLRAAVQRFLDDAPAQLAALRAAVQAGDAAALAACAHRMRGAAANLALLAVQQCAAALELAAEAEASACAPLVDALDGALADVRAALACTAAPDAAPTPAPLPPGRLDAQACAEVRGAIDALAPALARGELPAGPVTVLEQHLSAAQMGALREALERFDFDQARAHLDTLRERVWPDCY